MIEKIKQIYIKNKEIINYLIVGVLTTIIGLVSYYICVFTFLNPENPIQLQIANTISWVVAVTFAYFTNRKYVFESENKNKIEEATKFVSSRLTTLALDMILMWLGVTILKFNDKIIKIISQILVIIGNYILSKLFVFKKEKKEQKKNILKKWTKKDITIITVAFMTIIIVLYELFYCNANYFSGTIDTYAFSIYRIIVYIFAFIMFFLFKNRFIDTAIKTFENKTKKNIVYTTMILSVVLLIILLYFVFKRQIMYQLFGVIVITFSLINIFVIYINNNYTKNCIIICLTIGIIFSIVMPLNHILDEKRHFLSAYNLSYGNFDFKKPIINECVQSLPQSRKYFVITSLFSTPHTENFTYEYEENIDIKDTPATYSPIFYIASALGIFISRIMGGSLGDIFMTGRLFGIFAYTALSILVLKTLPYKKKVFYVVLCLPLLIALSATYSIDGITVLVISLFVAYVLRLYEQKENIMLKQIIIILLIYTLVLMVKVMAYIPIALILLLILPKLFKQNKKLLTLLITGIILITLAILISYSTKYTTEMDDPRGKNVNSTGQIEYILQNPKQFLILQLNHIQNYMTDYNRISQINHSAIFRQKSSNIFFLIMLLLLYVSITDNSKIFNKKIKFMFLIIYISTLVIIGTMMYIAYTEVGKSEILGFQIRYMLPLLAPILMCINNKKITYIGNKNEIFNITILIGIFSILSITRTILLIS